MSLSPAPVFFDDILKDIFLSGRRSPCAEFFPVDVGRRDEQAVVNLWRALARMDILCVPVVRIWVDGEWPHTDKNIGGAQVALEFQDQVISMDGVRGWEALLDQCSHSAGIGGPIMWSGPEKHYSAPHTDAYVDKLVEVIEVLQARHLKGVLLEHVKAQTDLDTKPVIRSKI